MRSSVAICASDKQSMPPAKRCGLGSSPLLSLLWSYKKRHKVLPDLATTFESPEVRPPHCVIQHSISNLACNYRFYVHVYGLKARGLKPRSTDSHLFCVMNWDDYAIEKRTNKVVCESNPKWGETIEFYFSVPSLSALLTKYVVFKVYEQTSAKARCLGCATVDLMTIAGGPIHHDLPLLEKGKSRGFFGAAAYSANAPAHGRLIVDIRMTQICELMINPVEVLVHFHESLEALDQVEVDGVGTRRSDNPLAAAAIYRTMVTDAPPSELKRFPFPRKSSDAVPPKHQQSAEKVKAAMLIRENEDCLQVDDPAVATDEFDGAMIDQDLEEPILAEWQLAFIPTGVDETVSFNSVFTPICDKPYWNVIDHTILNQLIAAEQEDDDKPDATPTPSTDATGPSLYPSPETNGQSGPLSVAFHRTTTTLTGQVPKSDDEVPDIFLSSQAKTADVPSLTCRKSRVKSESALLRHITAAHVDHIEPQVTYTKLASICRKGKLVQEMLYDDLPTIQLETTSESLRQNHLKIKLYAKRLGTQDVLLYGEAWVPFFKIYDIDVIEESNHHFSDAYFHERLWYEGKCVGHISGVIVFQNNPVIRQMLAGVNTGSGFMQISPPILVTHDIENFISCVPNDLPFEIQRLTKLHQALLDILFSKTQHTSSEKRYSLLSTRGVFKKRFSLLRKQRPTCGAETDIDSTSSPATPYMTPSQYKFALSNIPFQASQPEFHAVCDEVLQILRISHVETRRSFLYKTKSALILGQRVFLNLAEHILEFIDYVPWQYRSTYAAILHQILRRGELDIGCCTFELPQQVALLSLKECRLLHRHLEYKAKHQDNTSQWSLTNHGKRQESDPVTVQKIIATADSLSQEAIDEVFAYHEKMKVCRNYILILHRILNYSLIKLCGDSILDGQQKYTSIYLTLCYFRVPSFSTELLASVLSPEERRAEIPEWRGTDFELDAQSLDLFEKWQMKLESFLQLNWQPLHDYATEYFGKDLYQQASDNYPQPSKHWKEVFRKRGAPFFSFLEHWAKYVHQILLSRNHSQWQLVLGYPTFLKAFLLDMRSIDVVKYPDALINCSGALLANDKLFSPFIKVIFLKTSAHDVTAIFATLNYLDYWSRIIKILNKGLPPDFDFEFFKKGIDIAIGSDLSLSVAKGIWYLYCNLPIFTSEYLDQIVHYLLLDKYFFTLAFSWSWLVRKCYMWLLIYRICEPARQILSRFSQKDKSFAQTVSVDELIIFLGYIRLTQYLKSLNTSQIFSREVTERVLVDIVSVAQKQCSSLKDPQSTASTAGSGEHTQTGVSSYGEPVMKSVIARLIDLEADSASQVAAITQQIPQDLKVYKKCFLVEFIAELQVYRNWMSSNPSSIPVMTIPSSPLDSNVDAPLG